MNKREFLLASGLTLAFANTNLVANQNTSQSRKKLPRLLVGDTIGIVAPATSVSDQYDIASAIEIIEYLGFKYKLGSTFNNKEGYKTKSANARAEEFNQMIYDPSIKAIFCIRGGYGSMDILTKIDYRALEQNPKSIFGYSDITAIHLAINKQTSIPSFHSPVLLSSFESYTLDNFKKIIDFNAEDNSLKNPNSNQIIRNDYKLQIINKGIGEGSLIGGNLSLISALMGTKYEIDTFGKILFLEDVGEEPYKIHRMMRQLDLSGKLDDLAGLVLGKCVDCRTQVAKSTIWDMSLAEVYSDILANKSYPIVDGMMIGHSSKQLTLPIGVNARLDSETGTITILENPFS